LQSLHQDIKPLGVSGLFLNLAIGFTHIQHVQSFVPFSVSTVLGLAIAPLRKGWSGHGMLVVRGIKSRRSVNQCRPLQVGCVPRVYFPLGLHVPSG
jgi:hypothetical protein